MPVMRVFYTFYIHSSFHLCNSFIRVIRDFNIRGMTTNCSTSSVTGQKSANSDAGRNIPKTGARTSCAQTIPISWSTVAIARQKFSMSATVIAPILARRKVF